MPCFFKHPNTLRCIAILVGPLASAMGLAAQDLPRIELRRNAAFPEPFTQVRGLRELSAGRVLVTDWTEERLLALDFETGTAVEIATTGGGPREVRLPSQLVALAADSTLLYDMGNARLAIIGPDLVIHRTLPARLRGSAYPVSPRGADDRGRLYIGIPPWAQGPDAPPGDSVDIVRWDPRTDTVEPLGRLQGARRPSWQREGRPRLTPGIPLVAFSPQDAWAVLPDGRVAVVRSGDYHVEWRGSGSGVTRGPSYAYPPLPVTEADKRAFVVSFIESSPMSGRGPDGGLGHTPSEFLSTERIAEDIRTNEFAERHPYFRAGGAWATPEGTLLVERSVPEGMAPVLDEFDAMGRMVRQLTLPVGRRVVGTGRGTVYAAARDADDLETLERYGTTKK